MSSCDVSEVHFLRPTYKGHLPQQSEMNSSAAEELLKRHMKDFEGAISAPSCLAFALFERDVIPYDVYNVSVGVNTGLSTAQKSAKITNAALESVASNPLLIVELVEASESHSETMRGVCSSIRMDPLYG